jgi:membrane protein YqaA with SNARE-associated domain
MDFLVWMYMFNTILQGGLAGLMWGMNRHVRPVWGVAFTITLGCVTGALAGWTTFQQSRRVKKTEGFPVEEPEEDSQEQLEKGSRMPGSDSDVAERQ